MSEPGMNEAMQGDAQTGTPPAISPGARLAACREEHGWTVEQVAAYLKLAPRQVTALERDDYAALPGMPIVRGFVRSYAKLLKIDAAPLLAQLGGETVLVSEPLAPKEGLAAPFSEARLPSMSEKPAISSKWVVGVLLLALLAAALWAFRQDAGLLEMAAQQPAQVEQAAPVGTVETVEEPLPLESEALPAPSEAIEGPADAVADAGSPANPATTASPATPPTSPDPNQAAPAPASPQSAPAATSGANTLNLVVREESWIEVRRAGSGSILVARLAQAGENISVEVTQPVVLVIGNAAGVDASLRGEPVELKGSTKTNVARLTLK